MLSPCPGEMHFSATQKRRRRARAEFRERKSMIPGVIIRALEGGRASERRGNAVGDARRVEYGDSQASHRRESPLRWSCREKGTA